MTRLKDLRNAFEIYVAHFLGMSPPQKIRRKLEGTALTGKCLEETGCEDDWLQLQRS